jgi:hypothetical protein
MRTTHEQPNGGDDQKDEQNRMHGKSQYKRHRDQKHSHEDIEKSHPTTFLFTGVLLP